MWAMSDARCEHCIHFEPDQEPARAGLCRRHAPRPLFQILKPEQVRDRDAVCEAGGHMLEVVWPGVLANDYCGEFDEG